MTSHHHVITSQRNMTDQSWHDQWPSQSGTLHTEQMSNDTNQPIKIHRTNDENKPIDIRRLLDTDKAIIIIILPSSFQHNWYRYSYTAYICQMVPWHTHDENQPINIGLPANGDWTRLSACRDNILTCCPQDIKQCWIRDSSRTNDDDGTNVTLMQSIRSLHWSGFCWRVLAYHWEPLLETLSVFIIYKKPPFIKWQTGRYKVAIYEW